MKQAAKDRLDQGSEDGVDHGQTRWVWYLRDLTRVDYAS